MGIRVGHFYQVGKTPYDNSRVGNIIVVTRIKSRIFFYDTVYSPGAKDLFNFAEFGSAFERSLKAIPESRIRVIRKSKSSSLHAYAPGDIDEAKHLCRAAVGDLFDHESYCKFLLHPDTGVTKALIYREGCDYVDIGTAICSKLDAYNPWIGKYVALYKALKRPLAEFVKGRKRNE